MSRVLVIGDSCQDVFVYCSCKRLAPEFPVQVLDIISETVNGGMASNVKANIQSLSVDCDIITNMQWEDVTKTRYVDRDTNYMFVRVDSDRKIEACTTDVNSILWNNYDAIIVSDYDKGFMSTEYINTICKSHPCVFLDTKKKLGAWAEQAKFIKINHTEYSNSGDVIKNNSVLYSKIIHTMGLQGAYYRDKHYPVDVVEVKDVSGAGDSFLAGLVTEYIKTRDIEKGIIHGNQCATVVVQKPGVSVI
jgi:bifunctional ADP-heptose synthase (sugar kinase/adenylyltransferase)